MPLEPYYDPNLAFEANAEQGPFGEFASPTPYARPGTPQSSLFGHPLFQPFGIPAGPVMNAKFAQAAFRTGYDLVVYKTVRSTERPSHAWPNILPITLTGDLTIERATQPVTTMLEFRSPLSITNSFGVPSPNPEVWQPDMARALQSAGHGQLLIGSFQGTAPMDRDQESFVTDYATAARLVAETGVPVLETNLSCPNEGTSHLVCFDVRVSEAIVRAITKAVPDRPLVVKVAYYADDVTLRTFVERIGPLVAGIEAINTIPAEVVTPQGDQALPGSGRRVSGICGAAIKWAGLDMVRRLVALRDELGLAYAVLGVGGVSTPLDYAEYRALGADAVLSATGSIWNPLLAQEVWEHIGQYEEARSAQWQPTLSTS